MEGMGFSFYFGLCSCLILSLSRSRNPLFRFSRVCDFSIRPHFRSIGLRDLKGTRGCSLRDLPRRRSFKHPDSPMHRNHTAFGSKMEKRRKRWNRMLLMWSRVMAFVV